MIDSPDKPELFFFGQWSFNSDAGDLSRGETTTRLEPQVAKLLEHFLANQNKVISRDELITAVWENRNVSDDAINRCVSILRQTLSPEDKSAYIETVVRKGYLAHFPPALPAESQVAGSPQSRKYFLLAALAGLVLIFLYTVAGKFDNQSSEVRAPQRAGPPMVAVLPFAFDSQSDDNRLFADGIQDDLLTHLAQLQSMRVISSTSVRQYRNTEKNMRQIGSELGADVILEGSVQVVGSRMRINAQLIDTRTDEHLWAEGYDRELTTVNIFDVRSEIARAIASALNTTLTAQDREQLSLIPTESMAAYQAYHRAMQLRAESNAAIGGPEYLQALEEAVELDPAFARAGAQLVNALAFQKFGSNDPDLARRAEQALQNLQAVAPGSAEYLTGQAAYVYYVLKDYDQAHNIVSQALTMNPGDIQALELRLWIERRQGDFDAALETRREILRLDPLNPDWTEVLLHGLRTMHRYDEIRAEIEASTLESFYISYLRSLLLLRDDRDYERFQQSIQQLCDLYDEPDCGWEAHIANRDYAGALESLDRTIDEIPGLGISTSIQHRILTYWLMKEDELLTEGIPEWQAQLEAGRDASSTSQWHTTNIGLAMLAGIQGNTDESELLIKRWLGPEEIDWANRSELRHEACRVLGMIGATSSAVKCIRDGLVEASRVTEFLEPYLPFYDPIRDQPEFVEMLAEIDGGASSKAGPGITR